MNMNIEMKELATDCHHSGIFPAPGGGKIITDGQFLYVTHGTLDNHSVVLQYDGKVWTSSRKLPIIPPYIAVDTKGYIHLAGLNQKERGNVWYYHSSEPYDVSSFDEGRYIHPRNYSSMAVDNNDDSLYYFGAGMHSGGMGFMSRTFDGVWSDGTLLGTGQIIYPGVAIRDGIMHLIFCGWNPAGAVYENVFYMQSSDSGRSWTRRDGTPIKIPFNCDRHAPKSFGPLDRVSRSFLEGHFDSDTHNLQIFIDKQGRPHVLYCYVPAYFPRTEQLARMYNMHVRGDSNGWKHSLISDAPNVDINMSSIVEDNSGCFHCVCVYRTKDRKYFDVGYCYSDDSGDNWSAVERLTDDADATQRSYMYPQWCINPFQDALYFICNRHGGGSLMLGRLPLSEGEHS